MHSRQITSIIYIILINLLSYQAASTWLKRGTTSFITNGKPAADGYFPYQAAIYFSKALSTTRSFCGGAVISRTYILTAAHCTIAKESADVRLGTINISSTSQGYRVIVPKEDIITHERFNATSLLNDIGLLRLQIPIDFVLNPRIKIINLPNATDFSYVGEKVNASGFGLISDESSTVSKTLQYATLTIVDETICDNRYKYFNGETTLCVATENGISTCNGDSGGALAWYNPNQNAAQVIGVVSYGSSAGCEVGRPLVFTRVDRYLDWINGKLGYTNEQQLPPYSPSKRKSRLI